MLANMYSYKLITFATNWYYLELPCGRSGIQGKSTSSQLIQKLAIIYANNIYTKL